MARFQNGWLQKKRRKSGDIWVFCYRRQRPEDGAWVQATPIKVGKVRDYPSEEAAWRRVEELHLNPNQSPFEVGAKPLFGELAAHYIQKELPEDQTQATIEKAYSTIRKYKRYLSRWALPRWGIIPALAVHPPDVEDWLRELKKKFELRKVPRAEPSEPLIKPDRLDEEPVDEVRSPSNDDSPVAVDALVVLTELPLVPAEVPVAWATAAACPASPAELVVGCGAANGVNCEAAAEEPA